MNLRKALYSMLIVIAVLPLMVFALVEAGMVGNRLVEARQSALLELAYSERDDIVDAIDRLTAQIWDTVNLSGDNASISSPAAAARASEALYGAAAKCGRAVSGAFKVLGIYLVNGDGAVLASSDQTAPGSMLESRALSDMRGQPGFFTSELVSENLSGDHAIPGVSGVWVSQHIESDLLLAAFINAEVFEDLLNRHFHGRSEHLVLLGRDGTVWTKTELGGDLPAISEDLMGNPETVGFGKTSSFGFGSGKIYGYARLEALGCSVVAVQDAAYVGANLAFLGEAGVAALLFALLALLFLIPFFRRHIADPIARLRAGMALVSLGDCKPVEIGIKNELGELADGFNHMVGQIQATFSSLQEANNALLVAEDRLQRNMERISTSEMRFKFAADLSTIAVFEHTPLTDEFFCSEGWETITTYPNMTSLPSEYVIRYIVHTEDRPKLLDWFSSSDRSVRYDEDIRFLTTAGDYKWVHISMVGVMDEFTKTEKILGAITDIHESVVAKEKATHAAYYETLTDLPRRVLFSQDVDVHLDKVNNNTWGTVYLLSMDNFKQINDIYGFVVGDRVLVLVAQQLNKLFSEEMYIARNSGNSFLLYEECPRIPSYIQETCQKIIQVFKKPFVVGELKIEVPVHMGAAMYPDHGHSVEELMRNADIAMHEARDKQLTGRYAIFNSDMLYKVERTHQIMEVLRHFEESKAMYMQYQPIIRASDRSCVGFEALVRLDTSPIGFISPVEFIPLAEQSKLIIPIGTAVLKESCVRAKELLDSGYEFDHISVNVSCVQLDEPDFVNTVLHVLEETGLPNEKLQIEVTESMMIANLDDSIKKLDRLRNCGLTVALDDFGTGYSSMKHLREIPLDVIKIDKYFVDELERGVQKLFAFTMIQLAHDLGLTVVAEGVESERQFALLREHGCDHIQGYCISRPLYSQDIERFLDSLQNGAGARQA